MLLIYTLKGKVTDLELNNFSTRQLNVIKDYTKNASGSVLISMGDTKVICTATIEDKVPPFMKNTGSGWLSAEYSMLPGSTLQRKARDISKGKIDGRSQEIQRLIGRSLRSIIDLTKIGERTIWIDCDVIQADGGTRTTSITGSYIALALACKKLIDEKQIKKWPIKDYLAAISVGYVNDSPVLDLCYEQDSNAEVDMNIVMNGQGEFVEVQGTSEHKTFDRSKLNIMLDLAEKACKDIINYEKEILGEEITNKIEQKDIQQKPKKEKIIYDNSCYRNQDGLLEMVIASSNKHKIEEMQNILAKLNVKLLSLKDVNLDGIEIIEDGKTFEDNALIKSRKICELTGKIAIADDSGLSVNELNGQPGIYSARFAGDKATDDENNKKLLKLMKGISNRSAYFTSVIAITFPDGREATYKGITQGNVGFEEKGNMGFGYDPLFIVKDTGKTYAEMTSEEKNKISHRSRALNILQRRFRDLLSEE